MLAPSALSIRTIMGLVLLVLSEASFANTSGAATEREFDAAVKLKADPVHGEQVFDTCAACHGTTGTGVRDGTVPAIAGQHFRVIVWQLVQFRHGQRLDPRMQHFTDRQHLNTGEQDIADVAAYVSKLQPSAPASTTNGTDTARAGDLYRRNCSSCHGSRAQGDDRPRNPRLAGQHYEYLLRQMQEGIQGGSTRRLAQHDQFRHRLTLRDVSAICEYLSQLSP